MEGEVANEVSRRGCIVAALCLVYSLSLAYGSTAPSKREPFGCYH